MDICEGSIESFVLDSWAALRAVAIGWGLPLQGRGYLESRYYREMEAPLDSCWVLDAMIGDGGRSIAGMHLTRPRSARPFQVDDVQRLDRLRPWLAHALRRSAAGHADSKGEEPFSNAGAPVRSGEMILTSDGTLAHETAGLEHLLTISCATRPKRRGCAGVMGRRLWIQSWQPSF
jgi:hypothetical protein